MRQTSLPESRYRSAAVAGAAGSIQFLYLLGGLHGETYRDTIYYNDPPPDTPIPTPIPPTPTFTPTPTPTPQPGIAYVHLSNQPTGVIAPGERLTYTIRYGVIDYPDSSFALTQVIITNRIPSMVALVPESLSPTAGVSITSSGVTSDTLINWTFLAPQFDGSSNSVSYVVQQPVSASVIINEGATITWQYHDPNGAIHNGRMTSGAIYNPLTTLHLPIIAARQNEVTGQ